jgi:SGNH hydrolase-like domain, acetyltransferase AlgX
MSVHRQTGVRSHPTIPPDDRSVSGGAATMLTVGFAVVLCLPLLSEMWARPHPSLLDRVAADRRSFGTELALQEVERHLVYESQFAAMVRQPYQRQLVRYFGQGSRTVLIGTDGMLFRRQEIQDLTGAQGGPAGDSTATVDRTIDVVDEVERRLFGSWTGTAVTSPVRPAIRPIGPVAVIADLHRQLAARGIHLVVVTVPYKTSIYPERMWTQYKTDGGPLLRAGQPSWSARLQADGVDAIDLEEPFWQERDRPGGPLYLARDTHWAPRAVELAASIVASHVQQWIVGQPAIAVAATPGSMPEPDELLNMIGLRNDSQLFPTRTIGLTRVQMAGDESLITGDRAPILLFGDSFSGYYDGSESSGVGYGGGLASQLMLRLHVGIQKFVGFGTTLPGAVQGAFDRGPNVLEHKQLVILETSVAALEERWIDRPFILR